MKGLLLLSGGIDSPVAGYLIKQRGVELVAVNFNNPTNRKTLEIVERLAVKIGIKKLYVVDNSYVGSDIVKKCIRRFTCILCRRLMLRIAEKIAEKEKCDFLITGENLGQVASQTLSNMISEHSTKMPVLRPLLCNDKQQTVDVAKRIRTFEISTEPGICCTLVPKCPATKSSIEVIEGQEKFLEINKIIQNSLETAKILCFDR